MHGSLIAGVPWDGNHRRVDADATESGTHVRMEQCGFPSEEAPTTRCKIRWNKFIAPGTCGWRAGLTMKTNSILYWTMTILVAFPIGSGGVAQIWQYQANPHGVVAVLGYPTYFFAFWDLEGAWGRGHSRASFPRLKEWAYAGIFFDLTGATASCAAVGGYGAYAFHVIAPLILTGFTVASWALRPESRKTGMLFQPSARPV